MAMKNPSRSGGTNFLLGALLTALLFTGTANGQRHKQATKMNIQSAEEIATFGSGCFWCTEAIFERVKGVHDVISGYAGGKLGSGQYVAFALIAAASFRAPELLSGR